jgi:putative spermidine/putrescine transport system ATP-binding protein
MATVELRGITKRFDRVVAVDNVSLTVREGEFFSLLGPSGCGKTTTLRVIAGFIAPTAGQVLIGGRDVTNVPPHRRDTAMVFQHYALFPHKSVFENVAFGLRMRGLTQTAIREKVAQVLEMVAMGGMGHRYPAQLSGGQQQRVALARAIVIEPRVLLFDEPLGALDKKLRTQMQFELRQLQRRLGITAIYVTHDQEEALTLSDRIAVMDRGRIVQVGTPKEIYERPQDVFVADFIGGANFLPGRVISWEDNRTLIEVVGTRVHVPSAHPVSEGQRVVVTIRPEKLRLVAEGAGVDGNQLAGTVAATTYVGEAIIFHLDVGDGKRLMVKMRNEAGTPALPAGARAVATWAVEDGILLNDAGSGLDA